MQILKKIFVTLKFLWSFRPSIRFVRLVKMEAWVRLVFSAIFYGVLLGYGSIRGIYMLLAVEPEKELFIAFICLSVISFIMCGVSFYIHTFFVCLVKYKRIRKEEYKQELNIRIAYIKRFRRSDVDRLNQLEDDVEELKGRF